MIKKHITILFIIVLLLLTACSNQMTTDSSALNSKQGNSTNTEESSTTPQIVVVPDVVGMDKDEALQKLKSIGLDAKLSEEPQYQTDKDENIILTQSIEEGVAVAAGKEIELVWNSHEFRFSYYEHPTNTVEITGFFGVDEDGIINVPSTYNGKPITQMICLYLPQNTRDVYIPNSIVHISICPYNDDHNISVYIDNTEQNVVINDMGHGKNMVVVYER